MAEGWILSHAGALSGLDDQASDPVQWLRKAWEGCDRLHPPQCGQRRLYPGSPEERN